MTTRARNGKAGVEKGVYTSRKGSDRRAPNLDSSQATQATGSKQLEAARYGAKGMGEWTWPFGSSQSRSWSGFF
jgi:hypothetical protein